MIRIDQTMQDRFNFGPVMKKSVIVGAVQMLEDFEVITLEGTMQGKKGDYLMKGVKGELYPCRHDIFWETYREV